MRAFFSLCFALLVSVPSFGVPLAGKHLTVELISKDTALVPGKPATLGLDWKLEPGWHIYWTNAGDSGEPPEAKWTLPEGMTAGALQFPAPMRLPLGPLMDFGYQDHVLMPVALSVASDVKPGGDAKISADLRWLVCREVCLPGKGTVELTLPVRASTSPNAANAEVFRSAEASLPVAAPAGVNINVANSGANFVLTATTGKSETTAQFYPAEQTQIANAAAQPATPQSGGVQLQLVKDTNIGATPARLKGVLELSGGRNYLVDSPVAAGATGGTGRSGQPSLSVAGTLRVALLAFLGGIILNLMPCVFPVLFLKGLSLVETQSMERAHARRHGVLYMLGILVSFWVIVGVLLALRAGGAAFGWGFQFQSPTFVALVTMLLFFFALSLAGQFEFGLSFTSAGGNLAQQQGAAGSFFTGVLATVVATPCTAPFMGAAIGFALAQSAVVAFLIFTAIALGLAAPYVALTLAPQWTRFLPKPGAWMEVLKQASSVPIFATAIWLTWLYVRLAGVERLIPLLAALLLLAIAGWALGRWPGKTSSAVAAGLLAIAAITVPIYAQRAAKQSAVWQPWSQAAVDQARAAGKPVFVDYTAAWCLSCQFNERAVLQSAAVEQAMQDAHAVRLKADWTQYDPQITVSLAALGRSGVPTYVVYPGNSTGQPDVLPEALTQAEVLHAIEQAGKGAK